MFVTFGATPAFCLPETKAHAQNRLTNKKKDFINGAWIALDAWSIFELTGMGQLQWYGPQNMREFRE